jgi:hypothetical protein
VSRAPKGTPTGTNLSVLLDYIDGRRESVQYPPAKKIELGMRVDLRAVAAVSAPHLRRCVRAELILPIHEPGLFCLTQRGVDALRDYCTAYPASGKNAERFP